MSDEAALIGRDRRDLVRGAWQILSGFGVRMAARVLLILFVAKLFGAAVFGRLGETIAILELSAAFASFGLTKTLLGELARDGEPGKKLSEAILFVLFLSVLIALVLAFAWPIFFGGAPEIPRIAAASVPLIALADVALTATRFQRTVAWDTAVKALIKPWSFLLFSFIAFGFVSGRLTIGNLTLTPAAALIYAYIASLLVSAAAAFFAMAQIYRNKAIGWRTPDLRDSFALARRTFPIAVNETGVFAFRRADILVLGIVAGPTATGVYYLAQQIGTVVEKVRYLFEPMLAPIVAQSGSLPTIGSHLRRLCVFVFAVQLGFLGFFALFGEGLLAWFGGGFGVGAVAVTLFLLGELFDGSFGLTELPLVYRHPKWPVRAVLLALVIEIVLVWSLAQKFGAAGAAAGFVGAMFLLASARLSLVHKFYGFRIISGAYVKVLIAGFVAALAPIALLHADANAWVDGLAAIVFALVYTLAVRHLLKDEINT